jgi:hypothetical protein
LENEEAKYVADITFIQSDRVLPNFAPSFTEPLVEQEFWTNETTGTISLGLPKIEDDKNGTIKVTVEGIDK